MSVLDQVIQLKKRGVPESEIIRSMQQQGVSPQEIETALNQASIKDAVGPISGGQDSYQQNSMPSGMQPSLLDNLEENESPQAYAPPASYDQYAPQEQTQQYYSPQSTDQYAPQDYSYEPASAGVDSETITEIAEQVVQDKTNTLKAQVDSLTEFKALTHSKVEHLDDRLSRMEQMIDKLQLTLLERMSNYMTGIESVQKEMNMVQDSLGKVIVPLKERASSKHHKTESVHKIPHTTITTHVHHTVKKARKSKKK